MVLRSFQVNFCADSKPRSLLLLSEYGSLHPLYWPAIDYLATIDAFNFQYNGLVDNGRMEISPDGRYLAAMVPGGVRIYNVSAHLPEPRAILLAAVATIMLTGRRRLV
jgi:hypothetical protein